MEIIYNLVYDAFKQIEHNSDLFLDEEFIMNILSPLFAKLPVFEDVVTWYFEEKALYPVNIRQYNEKILVIDEARAELFVPHRLITCKSTTVVCVLLRSLQAEFALR